MFEYLKNMTASIALTGLKEKLVNPNLEGIGRVTDISFKDKTIFVTLVLDGLENQPIEACCRKIEVAPDGSSVKLSDFDSKLPFVKNALNRFAARSFDIPEGKVRALLAAAKRTFGL